MEEQQITVTQETLDDAKKEKKEKKIKPPKPPKAPKEPKAPKAPKAPKQPKAPKEPKPPKEKKEKKAFKEWKPVQACMALREKLAAGRDNDSEEKTGRYHILSSIKIRISSLVVLAVIVASVVVTLVMVSYAKQIVIDSAYAKMTNIVNSYGQIVSKGEVENNNKAMKTENYKEILGGLKVDGAESSSYCYVINVSGIITYSEDESKINKPNQVSVIKDVVAKMAKGNKPEGNLCCEYEEDGKTMYASYFVTDIRSVIVMCADGKELMAPINKLILYAVIIVVLVLAAAILASWFVAGRITKPISQVTDVINDTAKLKLRTPAYMDRLSRRRDETGVISRAVKEMTINLHQVVESIDSANDGIKENMEKLEESSNQVHMFCTDNSATTQQLSASTQEVASMTTVMSEHVQEMSRRFEEIDRQTDESNKASEEIAERAKKMQESTQKAILETKDIYEQIKTKTESAIVGLKAVDKINELTNAIMEISDQTSLLSLNASIEAARAGDAGRGFAVVATEISNLARRSLASVNDINTIIEEINGVVGNISVSMHETTDFLEKKVLAGYDDFSKIGDQYLQDAHTFKSGMMQIANEADSLNDSIKEVAGAVERIKTAIDETSIGVNDIAEKTGNVVESTSANYDLTNDTIERVNELKEIVDKFEF